MLPPWKEKVARVVHSSRRKKFTGANIVYATWFKAAAMAPIISHRSRYIGCGFDDTQIFEIFNILKIVKKKRKKLVKIIKIRVDSG